MVPIPRPRGAVPTAGARGGQAMPVKPKAARVAKPRAPRVAPIDPNKVATSNAMSAFRTALQQLQASTPQVDANAIRAPYQAASVATGQLGQGLQQAVLGAGQAAQAQYNQGFGQAQQQAAQFGISAGAGANPTALANNGNQMIAAQTQAQAAAAPQAATAWQQLLERTAAAKVGDANLQRQNSLVSAEQQLSGNLPSAIANEKQLGFQQDTARKNFALAVGTQRDRATNDLRDYLLGVQKTQTSAATARTKAEIDKAKLKQKTGNDAAKLRVSQQKLALEQRSKTAQATGLKGVTQAVKALSGTTSSAGTKKVAKGWDVQARPWDEDLGEFTGPAQTIHVPDKRHAPAGYKLVKGASAATHYETVPTSAGSAGLTAKTWDTQYRALLAQNPGQAAAVKALLGPRPKK
jgi:hypothetical protein